MCVLAFAWRAHPRWQLVVAGNRDELHARPAQPLGRWDDADHVLGGRDQLSGGTWLGVSEEGRFMVVTNLRGFGAPRPDAPSRGLLLKDRLVGMGPYVDPSDADLAAFNPFNLVSVSDGVAEFWTNRPDPLRRRLSPGVHGLSNGALDEPWPKTVRLKAILGDWLSGDAARPESLLDGLQEEALDAPRGVAIAPSDVPLEPTVSPIFIRDPIYGTRCGTVVAIDHDGQGVIVERRFDAAGAMAGETRLTFAWPR
ncbi:NRDE family protein [Sphingobium aquiterrae]|uniref:NRDE family protein n=1 Tax=Sphingobium aquiterrae TaxID=2038656 RepID=UPI003018A99A